MSDHDKRVLWTRMAIGVFTMLCACDCEHALASAIVVVGGATLFVVSAVERMAE